MQKKYYIKRDGSRVSCTESDVFQRFLYRTSAGKAGLPLLTQRAVSLLAGIYMSSQLSQSRIVPFIEKNKISLEGVTDTRFECFNDFFSRKLSPKARPVDTDKHRLIAPCDSKLMVYDISRDGAYRIKDMCLPLTEILRSEKTAEHYFGGTMFVFRLCVDDYHRYAYPETGRVSSTRHITGIYHTVNPIAYERYKVLAENEREYCVIKTENAGNILMLEVGAMMVGKIKNYYCRPRFCTRGEEKGMFLFGASTVVLLTEKNHVVPDADIAANSAAGHETLVRLGESVADII